MKKKNSQQGKTPVSKKDPDRKDPVSGIGRKEPSALVEMRPLVAAPCFPTWTPTPAIPTLGTRQPGEGRSKPYE